MKKLFAWAMVATLMTAGSAFAGKSFVARDASGPYSFGVGGAAAGPSTTNNDDSCDIGVAPAATLLLPYFEVDFNSPSTTARTTIFTVTNVSRYPQIAHVTVWTDWSYPVLDFNIFLTGYDVQSINMYDILARGIIAPPSGTTNATTPGSMSLKNTSNPNFTSTAATNCAGLPGSIPTPILADVRTGLTTGLVSGCGSTPIGGTHTNAIGYVTIDVAGTCGYGLPNDPAYYSSEILFDNVLIGDYQDVNPNPTTGNYAGGNPLVHIRAIPEGGTVGSAPGTNLPYTFYNRYQDPLTPVLDRRQPLPNTFAARYIQGGTQAFNTNYKIWREGITGGGAACSAYVGNSALAISEVVRFDEHENPMTMAGGVIISPAPSGGNFLPETSSVSTAGSNFPAMSSSGDVAGWMYLNLNNGGSTAYTVNPVLYPGASPFATGTTSVGPRPSQNWVIVSMFAEGRYSVDFDAAWLGNGCSPAPALSSTTPIGPAGGVFVCPQGTTCTGTAYTGTNVTP